MENKIILKSIALIDWKAQNKEIKFNTEGSTKISGRNGSGKSTIINLMMRFYDPQKGNIFVDGKNIKSYELPSLRRHFGVVFQNDFIFHDTISSNIKMGRNISDEDMKKAAENAMAAEFIERYEEGYEHYSAIHGAAFSGGQKQRVAIARALAGHPDIVLADEPTGNLDAKNAQAVFSLFTELAKNEHLAVVMVTHDNSLAKMCDKIYTMKDGVIDEN